MHIYSLLVLLPVLLDPVSSLVIPPAGETRACQDTEIHSKWGNSPVYCDRHNKIQQHIKPIKSEAIREDSEIGIQYHALNVRKPAKKNPSKDSDKKTSKPTDQKLTPGGTQPKSDSPKPETQGPLTRGRKKTQAAEQSPPTEDKKSQGQPSGTPTDSHSGSSAEKDKDKDKKKNEAKQAQTGDQTLTHRPKEDPKSSEAKPQTPGPQNEAAKSSDQDANKPGTQDGNGKGKAADKNDGDKKDDSNGGKKDYSDTMYHVVTPDPNTKKGEEDLNGERSYYRKIGDGNPNAPGRYSTHLPSFSGVQSHGQEPGVSHKKATETNQQARKRPGEREEEATTGHDKVNNQGQGKLVISTV